MNLDDPRHEWLQAYADGTASAETTAKLDVALRHDPAFRALFLEYLNVDVALSAGAALGMPADTAGPAAVPARTFRWLLAGSVVAVALVFVGLLIFQEPAPWATLSRVAGAEFAGHRSPGAGGLRNEEVVLDKGVLELRTRRGAVVVIEAPAAFRFESAQRLRLIRGKIAADVPPSAKGFTIVTRDGQAVDLGTKFGVDVPGEGPAEVHVFEGEVIARAAGSTTRRSLRDGEARQLASARPQGLTLRSGSFIRADEMPELEAGLAAGQQARAEAAVAAWRRDPALIVLLDFESGPLPPGTFRMAQGRWPGSKAPEFVNVGDHMKLTVGGGRSWPQLTMAAWVRLDRLGEPYQSLYHTDGWHEDKAGQVHWMINLDTTMRLALRHNRLALGSPGRESYPDSLRPVLPEKGRWVHLVVVYDSDAKLVRFYLNGVFDSEASMETAFPALLGPAQIGNWNQRDRKLSGRVDEFLLLGRTLTGEEVAALHAAGSPYR